MDRNMTDEALDNARRGLSYMESFKATGCSNSDLLFRAYDLLNTAAGCCQCAAADLGLPDPRGG